MKHWNRNIVRTALTATTACAFAFGAAQAYASDTASQAKSAESRIWIEAKTAVSHAPTVIQIDEPLPQTIVPLNTDVKIQSTETGKFDQSISFEDNLDFRNFDLIEDNLLFVGAAKDPEFDTLEARREQASYPKSLNVDPLIPLAGAGLATDF